MTLEMSEGQSTTNAPAPKNNKSHTDSEAAGDREQAKRQATARARAALAGYVLNVIGDGAVTWYLISSWNLSRSLPTLDAVEAFLDRAGAPA